MEPQELSALLLSDHLGFSLREVAQVLNCSYAELLVCRGGQTRRPSARTFRTALSGAWPRGGATMTYANENANRTIQRSHLGVATITRYLAGELPSDKRAAAEQHLKSCDECQTRLDEQRAVRQLVTESLIARPVPARVSSSLLARLFEAESREISTSQSDRDGMSRLAPVTRSSMDSSLLRTSSARARTAGRVATLAAVAAVFALLVASVVLFSNLGATRHPAVTPTATRVTLDKSQVTVEQLQMLSATDGWAVGTDGAVTSPDSVAVILHYTQNHWQAVQAIPRVSLVALSIDSLSDGWAIGTDYSSWQPGTTNPDGKQATPPCCSSPLMLHYSGGVWTKVDGVPDTELATVAMLSKSDGWAAGPNALLHYDGTTWSPVSALTPTGEPLGATSIAVVSSGEAWAVGGYTAVALHLKGGTWQPVQMGPHPSLGAVSVASASEGWAVGWGGGSKAGVAILAHLHNGAWTIQQLPNLQGLSDVSMISAGEGWAVGGASTSLLLHYAGGKWTQVPSPTQEPLTAVHMVSASDGWAAGDGGTLLRYQGRRWTPQTWDATVAGSPLPSVALPKASPTAMATLDANFQGVTVSGEVSAQLRPVQTTCTYNAESQPSDYGVMLTAVFDGSVYTLSMSTAEYQGSATYTGSWLIILSQMQPGGIQLVWQLSASAGSGTITVNADGRSGSVDASLSRQDGGSVNVAGPWRVGGACDTSLG
jgi:hypothetical protein